MSNESVEIGRLYVPIKQIADVLTASQKDLFVKLPGITGYFPMSIVDTAAKAVNHVAGGLDLSQTGVCPIGYDGNAYRELGSGTNFLSSSLDYGLAGTETYIDATLRGFTVGSWVWLDGLPSAVVGVVSKFGVVTSYGYALLINPAGTSSLYISSNGSALTTVTSSGSIAINTWAFIVARFRPAAGIDIFVNGQKTTNATAIPASCFVSSQAFEVGRYLNDNDRIFDGRSRDVFVCRLALSDALIEEVRQSSLPA